MPRIELDRARCTGCSLCEQFCPVSVFEMQAVDGSKLPVAVRESDCWACDTCVGQCPTGALRVVQLAEERAAQIAQPPQPPDPQARQQCAAWCVELEQTLHLRWKPVAISLIPAGEALPDVPKPRTKLRYCQSLLMARRGKSLLMTADCHACPDGTSILGITGVPPKLANGEIYVQFGKLASIEAARQMVAERPQLKARSNQASLVTPLDEAPRMPDVIAVIAQPEQMMWLCMAASYLTGKKFNFRVSGYNAQCGEVTVIPYTSGQVNISLGCYGCRASSDVSDDLMFMGIPSKEMPRIVEGLKKLGRHVIDDSRNKIYLPPQI